jgi:pimeloyl-ACP methyl ester carboxylesterase
MKSILACGTLCLLGCAAAHGDQSSATVRHREPSGHTVRVEYRTLEVDGIHIFYREAGPPHAPAVVLLHGFPSSSFVFRDLLPAMGALESFRTRRPPALIVWGRYDPFFTVDGARSYLRDLPDAELHFFDTGHFALETHGDAIAALAQDFLSRRLPH